MSYQFAHRNGQINAHLAQLIEEIVQDIDPDVHFVTYAGPGNPRCWLEGPENYADDAFKERRERLTNANDERKGHQHDDLALCEREATYLR